MNELLEIYLEASGGKYGDQNGIFAVRDHVEGEMKAKLDRAKRALKRAGYQDLGGQEWKPPLGKAPRFDLTEQTIRNAWLDAEAGDGSSWDEAKAVLDLINKKEISTGKALQMEPAEPGTMTQEEALDIVMANTDQVEALARVLCRCAEKHGFNDWDTTNYKKMWPEIARAAIAHLANTTLGRLREEVERLNREIQAMYEHESGESI